MSAGAVCCGWARASRAPCTLSPLLRQVAMAQDTPQPGGKLIIGLPAEPDNLDPHITPFAHSHNVMMNIFDTLVWQDPADASFKPGLATSWDVAPDGKTYTFKLRTDVTFHDGTPFEAEAVKFTFDRIVDPATKSGFAANLLGPYAGSDVVDPATIVVHFSEPYAPLLDSLSQAFVAIVSPAGVEKYGLDGFGHNPVGSGAYIFKEWLASDHVTLVKNPDYNWASPVFEHEGAAYVDEITFQFILDHAVRTGTIESGDTNVVETVSEGDITTLEGEGFAWTGYRDPHLDELLDTARAAVDQAERKRLYGEVQMLVMEQALVVPIHDQISYSAINTAVHDVKVDPRGYIWFYDSWIAE